MRTAADLGRLAAGSSYADEVPVYIPSRGQHIGGVITVPNDPEATIGVVLLAGRARDRAHRNGMWVTASRRLAAEGMYGLRLDYPGVGNSSGPPEVFDIENPPAWALEDACRFLLTHTPVRRLLVVATCFGGRLALQAAPRIPHVEGLMMVASPVARRGPTLRKRINALRSRFGRHADPGPPEPSNAAQQRREGGLATERSVSPAAARGLRSFLRRAPIYFLYGEQDFAWQELRFALERLDLPTDRYELEVVPGVVHSFQSVAIQDLTIERAVSWCVRIAGPGRAAAS